MKIQNLGQAMGIEIPLIVPVVLIIYMIAFWQLGYGRQGRLKTPRTGLWGDVPWDHGLRPLRMAPAPWAEVCT